jgi:molecular chaperone GrpE
MAASDFTDPLNTPPEGAEAAAKGTPAGAAENPGAPADDLAAAKKEATDNYDRYLRSVADLENFRRRMMREKDELRQYASSKVLEDLLPVMDNLALALTATKQPGADLKTLSGGVDMVLSQLKSALSNHGLKEINPQGQAFDANLHESIAAQPSAEVREGNVVTVVRTGYTLNGRLLRPASVVVSSGSAKSSDAKA